MLRVANSTPMVDWQGVPSTHATSTQLIVHKKLSKHNHGCTHYNNTHDAKVPPSATRSLYTKKRAKNIHGNKYLILPSTQYQTPHPTDGGTRPHRKHTRPTRTTNHMHTQHNCLVQAHVSSHKSETNKGIAINRSPTEGWARAHREPVLHSPLILG